MNRIFIPLVLCLLLVFAARYSVAERVSHKEYSKLELKDCNACHKEQGIALTHDNDWAGKHHQNTDWMGEHRAVASKAGNICTDCHKQSFCLECHAGAGGDVELRKQNFGRDYMPKSHRSDFIQIHPVKAKDNPNTCGRCHDEKAFCASCHSRFPAGLRIKSHLKVGGSQAYLWKSDHANEARRNLQSCQACHADGDVCLKCHSAKSGARVNPHPREFKGSNLKSRSDRSCRTCH